MFAVGNLSGVGWGDGDGDGALLFVKAYNGFISQRKAFNV